MNRKKRKRKNKPGQGRKPGPIPVKPVRLSLDDATVSKGRAIGSGNLSAGVRTAVDHFPIPENDPPESAS